MIYIMRRTQLYLEDDLWNALHAQARSAGTSISQLVREAVRERYLGKLDERRKAMQAFVGIRQNRKDLADTETYVRKLRRGQRLEKLYGK
jgi:hypothetical protein